MKICLLRLPKAYIPKTDITNATLYYLQAGVHESWALGRLGD